MTPWNRDPMAIWTNSDSFVPPKITGTRIARDLPLARYCTLQFGGALSRTPTPREDEFHALCTPGNVALPRATEDVCRRGPRPLPSKEDRTVRTIRSPVQHH
ncbi:hypothetical protein ALC53_01326 [Atta colombica]|uniref:Uncharacterized protein n=1 Tax=Atta colombica TaxID=520822 RepID=A0A195BWB8_9HYME|nr:hypothetical protein ALC53_01326 [Atta colombica]